MGVKEYAAPADAVLGGWPLICGAELTVACGGGAVWGAAAVGSPPPHAESSASTPQVARFRIEAKEMGVTITLVGGKWNSAVGNARAKAANGAICLN